MNVSINCPTHGDVDVSPFLSSARPGDDVTLHCPHCEADSLIELHKVDCRIQFYEDADGYLYICEIHQRGDAIFHQIGVVDSDRHVTFTGNEYPASKIKMKNPNS